MIFAYLFRKISNFSWGLRFQGVISLLVRSIARDTPGELGSAG